MTNLPKFFKNARKIGSGGFGTVFLALNIRENRRSAVKQIPAMKCATVDREIQALAKVRGHDGIVNFHNAWRYQGSVWLEMEYCEEGSLNTFYKKNRGNPHIINPSWKFKFMKDTTSALQYLHSINITHRDLKPDNILISSGSHGMYKAKITDFGLAKIISDRLCNGNIMDFYMQSGAGSLMFMAPEVFGRHYTIKVDIFSLGLIFASLIMGAWSEGRLFLAIMQSRGSVAPIGMIQRCNQQFTLTLPEDFPASTRMKVLLLNMMSADYHHRPSSEDVMAILDGMDGNNDIRTPRPGASPYQPLADEEQTNKTWWAIGAIGMIILIVLTVMGFRS